jgi:hypothetical protein
MEVVDLVNNTAQWILFLLLAVLALRHSQACLAAASALCRKHCLLA